MEKMHSDDERGKFDLAALVVSKRERERERERRRQRETKRRYTKALSLWWLLSVGVRVLKFFFFDTISYSWVPLAEGRKNTNPPPRR
jgi:hypothetical protein